MNLKKLVSGLLLSTALAASIGVSVASHNEFQNESRVVEAAAGKSTKEYPMIVNCYGDLGTGFFDGCDVGLYCWGGDLITAKTVKIDKFTNHMGVGIFPKGAQYMKVVRAGSGSLPCDGWPSTVHNEFGQWSFDSGKNVITIKSWGGDQEYNDNKAVLFKDMPVMFDTDSGVSSWWFGGATSYCVALGNFNNWYDYTSTESWHELTRIGSTGYMYFIPSTTIICNGVVASRNKTGQTGWGNKYNQSTDMYVSYGYNSLYTTQIESGKTGDNQNWGNKGATETAWEYGSFFTDKITCSGSGSITSAASNWTTVKNFYDGLTKNVQGEIWNASGSESGSNIEQAMARYDYIVFFKQYSGYNDFINRITSPGKSHSIRVNPLNVSGNVGGTIAIIVISSVSLAAVGGYFLFKRKKEN